MDLALFVDNAFKSDLNHFSMLSVESDDKQDNLMYDEFVIVKECDNPIYER